MFDKTDRGVCFVLAIAAVVVVGKTHRDESVSTLRMASRELAAFW